MEIAPVYTSRPRLPDMMAAFVSKPENVFIVFWLVVAMCAAVFARPCTGLDEASHIARAEQIAEGGFLPQEVNLDDCDVRLAPCTERYKDHKLYGGRTDSAIYEILLVGQEFNSSFVSGESRATDVSWPAWSDLAFKTTSEVGGGSMVTWIFPNTSINSPLAYLPYVIGFWMARLVTTSAWGTISLMRIFGLLAFGALVYLAIRKCPFGKWILVAIALSPNSVTVNSMVTADAMTSAFTFLYLSVLLRFFVSESPSRRDWRFLAVSLCGLALLKMPYICFGLMLFVAVGVNPSLRDRASLTRFTAIGVAALALFGVWALVTRGIETYTTWGDRGIDAELQLQYMLSYPIETLAAIWRSLMNSDFGLFNVSGYDLCSVPTWVIAALYLLAFLAESQKPAIVRSPRVLAVSLLGISLLVVMALGVALYLTFSAVGSLYVDGLQSRYFVPLLFPVMIGLFLIFMGNPSGAAAGKHSTCALKAETLSLDMHGLVPIFIACLTLLYMYYRVYRLWLPF